jgi:hypothetical protein
MRKAVTKAFRGTNSFFMASKIESCVMPVSFASKTNYRIKYHLNDGSHCEDRFNFSLEHNMRVKKTSVTQSFHCESVGSYFKPSKKFQWPW